MSSNDIEKFFKEVPNQAPPPVKDTEAASLSCDAAMSVIEDRIKCASPELYKAFREGRLQNSSVQTGTDVVNLVITVYISCIRDNITNTIENAEEQQKAYIALNKYKGLLVDMLYLSKDLNFNVDVSSVLCTIHGAIERHLKDCIEHD